MGYLSCLGSYLEAAFRFPNPYEVYPWIPRFFSTCRNVIISHKQRYSRSCQHVHLQKARNDRKFVGVYRATGRKIPTVCEDLSLTHWNHCLDLLFRECKREIWHHKGGLAHATRKYREFPCKYYISVVIITTGARNRKGRGRGRQSAWDSSDDDEDDSGEDGCVHQW